MEKLLYELGLAYVGIKMVHRNFEDSESSVYFCVLCLLSLCKKNQMDITDDSEKLRDFAAVSARIFAYFIAKPAIAWTNGHIILVAAASYLRISRSMDSPWNHAVFMPHRSRFHSRFCRLNPQGLAKFMFIFIWLVVLTSLENMRVSWD